MKITNKRTFGRYKCDVCHRTCWFQDFVLEKRICLRTECRWDLFSYETHKTFKNVVNSFDNSEKLVITYDK